MNRFPFNMHLQGSLLGLLGSLAGFSLNLVKAAENGDSLVYRITSFGVGPSVVQSYSNTRAGDPVQITRGHVSNPIKATLREGRFLDFFAADAGSEDPPAFSLEAGAAGRSDLLVLLIEGEDRPSARLIDLTKIALKPGGQYVYNLLPMPIAVQCGKDSKQVTIASGKSAAVPPPREDKVIQTLFHADESGRPVKFSSSLYFKDEGVRQIVFCHGSKGAKRPKVTPIMIYKQAPKEAEP